jgi:hypothetical protein
VAGTRVPHLEVSRKDDARDQVGQTKNPSGLTATLVECLALTFHTMSSMCTQPDERKPHHSRRLGVREEACGRVLAAQRPLQYVRRA